MVTWSCHGAFSTSSTRLAGEAGSKVDVEDKRSVGSRHDFRLHAELSTAQLSAVREVFPLTTSGLLVAPPGSGKTVMACSVIADRNTSTLVLVDRKTLADQWRQQIQGLLGIKPGQLVEEGANSPGSPMSPLFRRWPGATTSLRRSAATARSSWTSATTSRRPHSRRPPAPIPARWWLGLTATPYRRDRLDDLIAFQLGPYGTVRAARARHTRVIEP